MEQIILFVLPEVNTGSVESIIGPDGAVNLLVVTKSNLLMINFSNLPSDGDSDEVRQTWIKPYVDNFRLAGILYNYNIITCGKFHDNDL